MKLDLSLKYEPTRVICMVCPSRSGSTVIKHALGLHPDLTSLAGEHEPYLKLAHNGYPWHASDEFHELNNPELVRILIANELYGNSNGWNRRWLQHHHIEEPPYVPIDVAVLRHSREGVRLPVTDTLLLKTPQDVYRKGIMEQLYPNAEVSYVIVRRDARAIINGLMDGWEAEGMFEARLVGNFWWKFDMPPRWWTFTSASVKKIASFQAYQALSYCERFHGISVRYEEFTEDWRLVTRRAWKDLGLRDYKLDNYELPILMATDAPEPERWRKKRPWLADMTP